MTGPAAGDRRHGRAPRGERAAGIPVHDDPMPAPASARPKDDADSAARGASLRERLAGAATRHPAKIAAAAAAAMFLGTLSNQPVLDDGWAVIDSPSIRTLDLARIFARYYGHTGGGTVVGTYRPLATLSFAVQYALHGLAPVAFHAVNVLLHAAASGLVVLLARRVLAAVAPARAAAGALGAGLLFAVHPAHVEAIAPMVARADLLAGVLGLAALLLALTPLPRWRLPAASAALAAAALCKEIAATVPLLYVLVALLLPGAAGLDEKPGLATPARRRALVTAASVALALATALAPYFLLKPGGAGVPAQARWFQGQTPAVVWNTMTRALAEYWRILVFPWRLMTDFGYAARIPSTQRFGMESALATVAWGSVLAIGILSARRAPVRSLAVLWTFTGLLPVLNVVPIGVLMAERFIYLPSVGICIWAGQLPQIWRERARSAGGRTAVGAILAAVLVLLAARALTRAAVWRTPERLYEAELLHAPLDPVVNNNLAVEFNARGDYRKALERLDVALGTAPWYWRAHLNRALALHRLGDDGGARVALARAKELAPREAGPARFAAGVLVELGDVQAALAELALAERLDPEDPVVALAAGKLLVAMGRLADARAELRRAAALDPGDPEPARVLSLIGTVRDVRAVSSP